MFCSSDCFTRRQCGVIYSHPLMQPALGLSGQQESICFPEQYQQQVWILIARYSCAKQKSFQKCSHISENFHFPFPCLLPI